jgi:hypothetical protein
MNQIFVIDTVAFINYYNVFFEEKRFLSDKVVKILDSCLSRDKPNYKLIIPSIVLLEVFDKQLKSDEKSEEFKYTILKPLMDNDDVEIKSIEPEVVVVLAKINDPDFKLENHDLIVLSSAVQMDAPIITNDRKIISFLNQTRFIKHLI